MRRPFWWPALCVLALVVAPLAMSFAAPVTVALAEPSAPAALRHDQVVVLSPGGQIQAIDLYPQSGMKPANWTSEDAGWEYIAAGDFNGDGDQEIAAIGGNRIKVFDPFVQPGKTAVQFESSFDGGRYFRLITTGDFDGDGKDEIATTVTDYPSAENVESLRVYDGGVNGAFGEWSQTHLAFYAALWQALAAGDFGNFDDPPVYGADELVMLRNVSGLSPFIGVYSGHDWHPVAESGEYGPFPWITVVAGNLSGPGAPDRLALLRSGAGPDWDSLVMQNVLYGGFEDTFPDQYGWYPFNPNFTSMALSTLISGQQKQIFLLRDPQDAGKTSLLMINPTGQSLPSFELNLDYGGNAWHQVRTGDLDGDGLSEVVILRHDRFRVFTQPQSNAGSFDTVGSYRVQPDGTDWPVMVVANLDGPGIASGPMLNVSPASLTFDVDYGAETPVKALAITNSGTSLVFDWRAQVTLGTSWLMIDTATGTTPGHVYATVRTDVSPGTYGGTIRITATNASVQNSPVDIPVTLNLKDPGFVASPTELTIWQEIGGTAVTKQVQILRPGLPTDWVATSLPLAAGVSVADMIAAGRITVKDGHAAVDGQAVALPVWLHFTPESGTTPTTMTVSAQPTTPGRYRAVIIIAAQDSSLTDPLRYVEVNLLAANQFYFNYLPLTSAQ